MAMDARVAAARAIAEVLDGKSLNQALPPWLEKVSPRDRGLLQQLCFGTLRLGPRLQGYLGQMLDKPLKDRDRDVQALLLCGLYQLEDTRIPDHAAVSETVAATTKLKKGWARGMSNAVLRRFIRERDTLTAQLSEAARLAHPDWLLEAIQQQWPGQAAEIVACNNSQPPMTLRINVRRTDREAYLELLATHDIAARPGKLAPTAIYLERPRDVASLPGFAEGLVSVQDEAAQLAAPLLDPQPGERILDACAAPGGKTCHLLELQPELAHLMAMDLDPGRLGKVQENLERLGLSAELMAADGGRPPPALADQLFDRILVDAPCSASGVIRRHPDVKHLRRAEDITGFARQQRDIVTGLWPSLRSGGRLVYATCSILTGENEQTVQALLDTLADAKLTRVSASWGSELAYGRQVIPEINGPDGLYYAILEKSAAP